MGQPSRLRKIVRFFAYVWASPWTLFALSVGWIASFWGARFERLGPILICYDGPIKRLLSFAPIQGGAAAMTFGHVVLAKDRNEALRTYAHEMVHVKQYERWGIFFIPAYLIASVVLFLMRKDAYLCNPFEREAYAADQNRSGSTRRFD